jgi:hypothetical protein
MIDCEVGGQESLVVTRYTILVHDSGRFGCRCGRRYGRDSRLPGTRSACQTNRENNRKVLQFHARYAPDLITGRVLERSGILH